MFLFFPSAQQDHPPFPFWASLSSSHCTPQNRAQLPLLSDSSCTAHQLLNNKANPLPASPRGSCVPVPLLAPLLGCSSLSTLLPSCNNHTPDTAFQAGSSEQQVNPGFPAGILVFPQAVLELMEHRTQLSPCPCQSQQLPPALPTRTPSRALSTIQSISAAAICICPANLCEILIPPVPFSIPPKDSPRAHHLHTPVWCLAMTQHP